MNTRYLKPFFFASYLLLFNFIQEIHSFSFGLELALDDGAVVVGDDDLDVFEFLVCGDAGVDVDEGYSLFNVNDFGARAVERQDADGLYFAGVGCFELVNKLLNLRVATAEDFVTHILKQGFV